MPIYGNAIGGIGGVLKTVCLIDDNGNEMIGVVTDKEQMFTAKPLDVKVGKKVVTDDGIIEGTNTITYRTDHSVIGIQPGESYTIPLPDYDQYNYTRFQCIICPFNGRTSDSVAADKVVINDYVYAVKSTTPVAQVTKNTETKSIDLNITNDSENRYLIRYFTYHEEE